MNLLAHLWLADRSHTSAAGQILGDIVKGRLDRQQFGPELRAGIRLHRLIDSCCDAHEAHRNLRHSFKPPFRRYAGILVDIGFDHALALNWADFSAEPLPTFAGRLATTVFEEWPRAAPVSAPDPGRLARVLSNYTTAGGIDRALVSVGARLKRPNPLNRALPVVLSRSDQFAAGLPPVLEALENEIATD